MGWPTGTTTAVTHLSARPLKLQRDGPDCTLSPVESFDLRRPNRDDTGQGSTTPLGQLLAARWFHAHGENPSTCPMPLADDSRCQGSLPPAPPLTEPALTPLPASSRPRPAPPGGSAPPKPNVTRPGGELAIASSAWGKNDRRVARAASRPRGPGAPVRHDESTSMVTGARTRALRPGRRRSPGGFPRPRRSSAGQGLRRLFRCQSGHRGWLPDGGSSSPIRRRSLSERSPTSTRIGAGNLLITVGAARIWSAAARVGFLSTSTISTV